MAGSSVRIATLQTATVQGVIGMAGTATLPAMGAAVTAGGGFRVVDFAMRSDWPGMAGLAFLTADDAPMGEAVMTLPDGATVQFREAVLAFS
ncbi:MAG: hypothetical protein NTY94_02220 [Alphaproteobacteria bacterium]|nr:hypothetical protein [Alphaproteobacteria bacterium]